MANKTAMKVLSEKPTSKLCRAQNWQKHINYLVFTATKYIKATCIQITMILIHKIKARSFMVTNYFFLVIHNNQKKSEFD